MLIAEIVGSFVCSVVTEAVIIQFCLLACFLGRRFFGRFLLRLVGLLLRRLAVLWVIRADAVFVLMGRVAVVVMVFTGAVVPVAAVGVRSAGMRACCRNQQQRETERGNYLLLHIVKSLNLC